ncbi:MAG: 50S ribosomal protein L34e [Candidatus Diapherotrites archaeon]|uniref:50S ribosomal protein L34e n=1 Tax=Candidatus Iainarchaeum sp. TaxID=3101447 RepID=A0A2D6M0M9_9ARCH|nr:50S ribosomal protein L34e [Candidatus Diapherotrites archaeon]|tara:strand:+ start:10064 stop:10399 length:336 start_codon:yes stop_codon:yes gene_type:complete
MTSPGQKTKKKKKRRSAKGSKEYYVREKTSKRQCGVCGGILQGVPHGKKDSEVRKLSKTQRRPSVPFGGVLCTKCRRIVAVEKAKVENDLKKIKDVDLKLRKYLGVKEDSA